MAKKLPILGVVIIIVFASGWYLLAGKNGGTATSLGNRCPRSFEPVMTAEPYYKGVLFDAHLHLPTKLKGVSDISVELGLPTPVWDDELSLDYLKCLFDHERMYGAYGFHLFTKYSMSAEVNMAKEMERRYPGMITHFLMPTMVSATVNPDLDAVAKVLADNPGLFRGMGELKMYDGKDPDDLYVLGLIDLARKYNLIVMMHPFVKHKDAVLKIVRLYPDVKFLFHGLVEDEGPVGIKRNLDWLEKLIANNSNVYYSIDAGIPIYGWLKRHQGTAVSKEESLPYVKSHFKSQLEQYVTSYKRLIETYPSRFLRGTDRWHRPHYDQELSALMEEYSRAFIGRMAPEVQEKFAHRNADKLLKK